MSGLHLEPIKSVQLSTASENQANGALVSIAISLKRIADFLDAMKDEHETRGRAK